MSDYYNGINREEDRQIKLQEKVDKWWHSLNSNYQFELVKPYYPSRAYLLKVDSMWNNLDRSEKVSLWEEELEGFHGVKI